MYIFGHYHLHWLILPYNRGVSTFNCHFILTFSQTRKMRTCALCEPPILGPESITPNGAHRGISYSQISQNVDCEFCQIVFKSLSAYAAAFRPGLPDPVMIDMHCTEGVSLSIRQSNLPRPIASDTSDTSCMQVEPEKHKLTDGPVEFYLNVDIADG